jgi:ABC-2 type transport system permease protein
MTNILAIVRKEWRGYFASPIGYVVIGMYALVFGYFYTIGLSWFIRQSMQAPQMGAGPMNINQQMIRYVFLNSTIIFLFVVPLITMRTYSEEKRSGTIELLMTSPITDYQIVMGKFLGALSLYGAMLGITLIHIGVLFAYGSPEWKPILTGYLGLLLLGGCFVSVGLFFSSLTRNRGAAAAVGHRLGRRLRRALAREADRLPVAHWPLGGLSAGGHRHPARCVLPELHHFRPVPDGQGGGQRAVAGIARC